jgi:cytochrome c oxidase subunit 3
VNIVRRLTEKPWLAPDLTDGAPAPDVLPAPTARIGLWLFLGVVTTLFGLFASAYMMRMEYADWRPMPDPGLLWINTLILALGSVGLHTARTAARDGRINALRAGLLSGGGLTIVFLIGQLWAWQQLSAGGYFAASNPANAFYYLLTGVHGLHLAGGLYVWGKVMARVMKGLRDRGPDEVAAIRLSIELCSTYWHYLLLVWLAIFALLLTT